MRLTLLHFNDLHGHLDQLPRLATLIQHERHTARAQGRAVLLFDCGDSSDPRVWESHATTGRANYALLEALGVEVGVVGNNEVGRWGKRGLDGIANATHFPLLAANLRDLANPEQLAVPNLKPASTLTMDGYPIGVIGLTAVFPKLYTPLGYLALDPLPVLQSQIAHLRAQKIQTILLLSHLGYLPDARANPTGQATDLELARACPMLTAILGGHTHTALETPVPVGGVLIAQAGDHGRYLGKLELDLDPATGHVQNFSGQLIPVTPDIPPDPTISGVLELVREEAERLKP